MVEEAKAEKGTFEVAVRCVVTKVVLCRGCSEEQARSDPWDYAVDILEVEQVDWKVKSVKREA